MDATTKLGSVAPGPFLRRLQKGPPRAASGAKVAKQGMEVLRTACAYTNSAMPHVIRFTSPATCATGNTCVPLGLANRTAGYQLSTENPRREPGFSLRGAFIRPCQPAS